MNKKTLIFALIKYILLSVLLGISIFLLVVGAVFITGSFFTNGQGMFDETFQVIGFVYIIPVVAFLVMFFLLLSRVISKLLLLYQIPSVSMKRYLFYFPAVLLALYFSFPILKNFVTNLL